MYILNTIVHICAKKYYSSTDEDNDRGYVYECSFDSKHEYVEVRLSSNRDPFLFWSSRSFNTESDSIDLTILIRSKME